MNKNLPIPTSKPIPVNPALVWDYEIPLPENQSDAFRQWYLSRVLTRGSSSDLQAVGFDTIYTYLPGLNLPATIRDFWNWYFNLPDVKPRYESTDTIPTNYRRGDQ